MFFFRLSKCMQKHKKRKIRSTVVFFPGRGKRQCSLFVHLGRKRGDIERDYRPEIGKVRKT